MKVKPNHRRDFWAYVRFYRRVRYWGSELRIERGNQDTLKAFVALESQGRVTKGVRHPRLYGAAVVGKKALNFHVTELWGPDYALCGGEGFIEELRLDFPFLPEWVWDAVRKRFLQYRARNPLPDWASKRERVEDLLFRLVAERTQRPA